MELDLSWSEYVLVDHKLVETRDGALDPIIVRGMLLADRTEGFGEHLRLEADFVEPVGEGEFASPGEVLRGFLAITGLLPRLRELEAGTGEFVGKSRGR